MIQSYRDLLAWQRAMDLCRAVYRWTESMPRSEQFGLTMQMRRCAVSIASNIAEGYGRGSKLDYTRFLRMSRGSIAELETQVELSVSLGLLPDDDELQSLLTDAGRLLHGLIKSLEHPKPKH